MKKILITFGLILAVAGFFAFNAGFFEKQAYANSAADLIKQGAESTGQKDTRPVSDIIKTIINTMLFIIGVMAVIMIIWGGIRYVLSAGNSAALTSAKNTIVYSIIGLIIAILAFVIVDFVIGIFAGGNR